MSNLHSWVRPMKNISPEEVYRCSWKEAVNWKLVWIVMCWSEPLVKHQIPVFDLRVDRTCFHVPENQWLEVGRWISYWHSPFFRWHVCFWGACFLSSKRYILPISSSKLFLETCLQLFFDIFCFLLWLFFCTSYKWNPSKHWGYYKNTMQTNFWMYAFCALHIPKNGLTFNSNVLHRFFNRNPLNEWSSCPHIPTKKIG